MDCGAHEVTTPSRLASPAQTCSADLWVDLAISELGVLFVGVLIRRALVFGVYIRAPDFWKPHPTQNDH